MGEKFCERHGGLLKDEADEYCDVKEIQIVHKNDLIQPGVRRFYVGRPTALGNPFVIGKDGTRAEVIAKYEEWLKGKLYKPNAVSEQFIRIVEHMMTECYCELSCWCAPDDCHAEVIREYVFEDDWLWK